MFCYESGFENYVPRRAAPDGCNINDPKTLSNLIRVSKFYQPDPKYLEVVQKNTFSNDMRKILTDWMFEISDVCEEGVLPHAVNLLDRYLSKTYVDSPRDELQVIGAVCLFLASKLRETEPIPLDRLCESSCFSYTSKQVRSWELKILNALNWDTSAVVPHDLLDHFLHRLPIPADVMGRVTCHARMLINMCCTEYTFLPHSSKMMATGCLYDAVFALGSKYIQLRLELPDLMNEFTTVNKEELTVIHGKISAMMAAYRNDLPPVNIEQALSQTSSEKQAPHKLTPHDVVDLELEGC